MCGAGVEERRLGSVEAESGEEALPPGVKERQHTGLWFRGTKLADDKDIFSLGTETVSFPHLSCYQDPPR